MYPIGDWPGFHLHGMETESRTLPKPDLLSVTDSVKISHPGLVSVVFISTIWPGQTVSATTFTLPG
jgi:hypothetical protein